MNLLIIRIINYKNKNKNKKFNSALKVETFENKNEFKSYNKNKNKSETKLKKLNEMSMSDNAEKKILTYINCNYCERQHSQSCFYKHSEFADEKWWKSNKTEINHLKKFKEKKIMSFNLNLSSDFSAQTQSKILAIQKKNSNWYLNSSVSFHVSDEKNKFMNLWKITKSSVTTSTETNFNTDSIETLKIQVNNQILMLHNSHYNLNTVTNLIFFKMLEWQEFEIEKIRKSDDLCLFRIINLENQIFTVN